MKYQRALAYLSTYGTTLGYLTQDTELTESVITLTNELQELVDKATPKKVTQFEHEGNLYCWCSKCDHVEMIREIDFMNYCPNCGQKLDWSKDE
jgi:hypothetical protein